MENLDDYLGTPDEHFNANVQNWYFEFTGYEKPETDKPFDIFAKAIYDTYFFIQDNLNRPFGCIDKIKIVSKENKFSETEQLLLVNKILGILYNHPNYDKYQMVFIQIVDYRHQLSPWTEDPDIANHAWRFNFEVIKNELSVIQDLNARHKYLTNLLFDYSAQAYEIEEIEHEYYLSIGYIDWIKTEIDRCEYEQSQVKNASTDNKAMFQLSNKKGAKIDLIRILNALYEIRLIEKSNGQIPTKQEFFETMGKYLGVDLSNYHTNLSQAFKNQSLEVNLIVFEKLIEITKNAHYQTKL